MIPGVFSLVSRTHIAQPGLVLLCIMHNYGHIPVTTKWMHLKDDMNIIEYSGGGTFENYQMR